MDTQQLLRKKLLRQRTQLTANEQTTASTSITKNLSNHPLFLQSHTIAAYVAINCEIDPAMLINKAWQHHKLCYLPIARERQLIFCHYQPHTLLKKNHFNIPEPAFSANSIISPSDLDLVLVPLVGFTDKGQRLGMGAGFYDKSFSFLLTPPRSTHPFLLGLAYEWQKLESFAENSWDVPLDAVITEKKIYFCR